MIDTIATSEVRLAVVMNGGVSLAVWMGGVTHEMDLLRRASTVPVDADREAALTGVPLHDREIFWRWVQFCRERGVGRVTIDVVAGTSAGGLNGTLLATAVALGVPLDDPDAVDGPWLRSLWASEARLDEGKLIRSPGEPPQASILDGEFFRRVVDRRLHQLGQRADAAVGGEPVTLFVTATALGAADRRYTDSFDHPFDAADHRRLYQFSRSDESAVHFSPGDGEPQDGWWQPAPEDDFRPTSNGSPAALANAARASASFPWSFEPVREEAVLAARRVQPPATVEPRGGRWLVDGGVLDNAPFRPVLDAIARRPLRVPVRRVLVNVVPSRGTAGQQADSGGDLPAWPEVTGAVLGFPREADHRDDVERSEQLLARAEGVAAAPEALFGEVVEGRADLERAALDLLPQYRRARTVGGLLELRRDLALSAVEERVTRLQCRKVGDADALLGAFPAWIPDDGPNAFSAYEASRWRWGMGAAERVLRLQLRDLRRRMSVGEVAPPEVLTAVQALGAELSRVEAVRDDLTLQVRTRPPEAGVDDATLTAWLNAVFHDRRAQEALARCVRRGADAYATAVGGRLGAADAVRAGLHVEVCSQAFTAYAPFDRTAPFELLRLGPDVETPLVDRDPDAVQRARDCGERKLYGTRLKHFAAFGLPAWRSWDWTCGRLDAQVHLARALAVRPDLSALEAAAARGAAEAWVPETQGLTLRSELSPGADYATEREQVWGIEDAELVRRLRRSPEGEKLVLRLVDAAMRALPHAKALGTAGYLINTLLARRPQRWLPPLWAAPARLVTRRVWLGRIARYGGRG